MPQDKHLTDLAEKRVYNLLMLGGSYSRSRLIQMTRCGRKGVVLALRRLRRQNIIIEETPGSSFTRYHINPQLTIYGAAYHRAKIKAGGRA